LVENGSDVISQLKSLRPDLLLLDVRLPGVDGFSICRAIRQFSPIPIVMVTALIDESSRLQGFEAGVDDYVCKPFSPSELLARVGSVLRRSREPVYMAGDIRLGELRLTPGSLEAYWGDQPLGLTSTEFRLINKFVAAPNCVFSRDKLLDCIGGESAQCSDRAVDSHIKNLRRKLSEAAPESDLIQSVYGQGYRLRAPEKMMATLSVGTDC
jgi:two-component system response regulator BaeR